MDIAKATIDELKAEFMRLADVVALASYERQAILTAINLRKFDALARTRIRALPVLERDALRSVLNDDLTQARP